MAHRAYPKPVRATNGGAFFVEQCEAAINLEIAKKVLDSKTYFSEEIHY
jgi:hypothetical protein